MGKAESRGLGSTWAWPTLARKLNSCPERRPARRIRESQSCVGRGIVGLGSAIAHDRKVTLGTAKRGARMRNAQLTCSKTWISPSRCSETSFRKSSNFWLWYVSISAIVMLSTVSQRLATSSSGWLPLVRLLLWSD